MAKSKARDAIVVLLHIKPDFSEANIRLTNRLMPTKERGVERERKLTKRETARLDSFVALGLGCVQD